MRLLWQDAMDECEARTQGAFVAELRARLRTTHRARPEGTRCEPGSRNFILKRVISLLVGQLILIVC